MTRRTRTAGLLWSLTAFAAAFGYVEGAVVVYLRALEYPSGFRFPLAPMDPHLVLTEVFREAATIVLLLGVAFASAREGFRRFGVFAYCFGLWDLAYYATLKAVLGWPESWLAWDVLFLIPAVWTGPVAAPVLVAAGLVIGGALLLALPEGTRCPLRRADWLVLAAGGVLIVLAFLWNAPRVAAGAVPGRFPWWLFGAGYLPAAALFASRWSRRAS